MDVTVLGAGVIGLSLAVELHERGHRVSLLDPRMAATQASWAAAGMLAAEDPHNPAALRALAGFSASLYPAYLDRLRAIGGTAVPFQTERTVQTLADSSRIELAERSLEPRQLAMALLGAVQRLGISLRQRQSAAEIAEATKNGSVVVHAAGAWAEAPAVEPRKGQMLRVKLPPGQSLAEVYRSEAVYVVPRLQGAQAGTVLIGATVEDAGFSLDVIPEDLAALRRLGAELVPHLPALANPAETPLVEAWAGLRPATPDGLPLLGEFHDMAYAGNRRHLIAAGHFRNGILLAPGTAVVMADLLENRPPRVDLSPFAPQRFLLTGGATP